MAQTGGMRSAPLLAMAWLLSGCGNGDAEEQVPARQGSAQVECAIGGADEFSRDCTLERDRGAEGLELTLRHPDGGFRRLRVTEDGRGVVAADGAEAARVSVIGTDRIEVAIAADRYRLPATVRGAGAERR